MARITDCWLSDKRPQLSPLTLKWLFCHFLITGPLDLSLALGLGRRYSGDRVAVTAGRWVLTSIMKTSCMQRHPLSLMVNFLLIFLSFLSSRLLRNEALDIARNTSTVRL